MTNNLKVIENDLVPVYETSTGEKVVYGTELHSSLRVKSNYRDWIRNRLNDCEAVENEDFEAAKILAPSGQRRKEHIIKLDTAKEMAMLERNERGKQVRRYFIEIEKKYKANSATPATMQNLSPQLQLLINMELKQQEQDARITELADKTEQQGKTLRDIHDTLFSEENDSRRWITKCIGEIAKSPSFDGVFNRYQKTWLESYERLNEKIGDDINEILRQAKKKEEESGATKIQLKNISRQSVIAEKPFLRRAYAEVIKEMMVAYCVEVK